MGCCHSRSALMNSDSSSSEDEEKPADVSLSHQQLQLHPQPELERATAPDQETNSDSSSSEAEQEMAEPVDAGASLYHQQPQPEPAAASDQELQPEPELEPSATSVDATKANQQLRSSDSSDNSSDSGLPWLSEGLPPTATHQGKHLVDELLEEVEDAFVELAPNAVLLELKQGVGELEAAVERLTPRKDVEAQAQAPEAQRVKSLEALEHELANARRASAKREQVRQSEEFDAAQAIRSEERRRRQEQAQEQRQETARDYVVKMKEMKDRQRLAEDRRLKRDLLPGRKEEADHRREHRAAMATSARAEWERERRLQLEAELAYHAAASGRLPRKAQPNKRKSASVSPAAARGRTTSEPK